MILLDANVILDVWDRDPVWYAWSKERMQMLSTIDELAINPIIYAEISPRLSTYDLLDKELEEMGILFEWIPRDAAFWAGKAYQFYRRRGGTKTSILPDFFIGAHAAVLGCPLLTRDTRRYKTYFPQVRLIAPAPDLC
jgi:predicted nucleic acid-binding protein